MNCLALLFNHAPYFLHGVFPILLKLFNHFLLFLHSQIRIRAELGQVLVAPRGEVWNVFGLVQGGSPSVWDNFRVEQ